MKRRTRPTRPQRRLQILLGLLVAISICSTATLAQTRIRRPNGTNARRALIISLDGLDARYLLKRDEYRLQIPTLRRLRREGVWSQDVVSVYPSVTYPAHATIATGMKPAGHGIHANEVFNPPPAPQPAAKSWHWFARDLTADTLWAAAARKGLKSAMVSWPVSAGAGDFNIPEIWKAGTNAGDNLLQTFAEISAQTRPRGLVEEITLHDPSIFSRVTKDEGDDMRTRWAEYIIAEKRPEVVFVHLLDFDHFQHDFAPFTTQAFTMLEKADAYIARLLAAAERAGTLTETAVFIVSDHGFLPVTHEIRPAVILARAGLLQIGEVRDAQGRTRPVVTDWRVMPYPTAGSCAIILRDPKDRAALRLALRAFGADDSGQTRVAPSDATPKGWRILYPQQLVEGGVNPQAAFFLEGKEGYTFTDALTGEAVVPLKSRGGQHGYLPTRSSYRTSFIASGAGVTRRGSLGTIKLWDIAPTIARALKLRLQRTDGKAISMSRQ